MKTTKFYIILLITGMLFLQNCKRNNQEETSCNCPTSNLGITQANRLLFPNQPANVLPESPIWQWNKHLDTLRIAVDMPTGGESGERLTFFFKIENDCPRFIKMVDIYSDDEVVIDADTGEVIYGGDSVTTSTLPNFELQEWTEQDRIVGEYYFTNSSNAYKFWVDFTPQYHFDLY